MRVVSIKRAAVTTGSAFLLAACGTASTSSASTNVPKKAKPAHTATTAAPQPTTTTTTTTAAPQPTTTTTTAAPQPTTTTAAPLVAGAGCIVSQLQAIKGQPLGAAGSVAVVFTLKNTSAVECNLEGYPGLQMLNASGQALPTTVLRGSSVTVPALPVTQVSLVPGGSAYFIIGFSLGAGYSSASCPTSASVNITAPNDYGSLNVPALLNPYGGTTQNIQCGVITASPVVSTLPAAYQG